MSKLKNLLLSNEDEHLFFKGIGSKCRRSYSEERITQYLRHIARILYTEVCNFLNETYQWCELESGVLVEVQLMLVERATDQPHTSTTTISHLLQQHNKSPLHGTSEYDPEESKDYFIPAWLLHDDWFGSRYKLYVAFNLRSCVLYENLNLTKHVDEKTNSNLKNTDLGNAVKTKHKRKIKNNNSKLKRGTGGNAHHLICLLYTSPSPRDRG